MNYSKPEITVLGSADLVIQGPNKTTQKDSGTGYVFGSDCELDD